MFSQDGESLDRPHRYVVKKSCTVELDEVKKKHSAKLGEPRYEIVELKGKTKMLNMNAVYGQATRLWGFIPMPPISSSGGMAMTKT